MRIYLICFLLIFASCKNSAVVNQTKDSATDPAEQSVFPISLATIIGANDLNNTKKRLARSLGVSYEDKTFNVQFDLFRCSIESGVAAFATAKAKDIIVPFMELGITIFDLLILLLKESEKPTEGEYAPKTGLYEDSMIGKGFRATLQAIAQINWAQAATSHRDVLLSQILKGLDFVQDTPFLGELANSRNMMRILEVQSPQAYKNAKNLLEQSKFLATHQKFYLHHLRLPEIFNVGFIL